MTVTGWRKSGYSAGVGECVEVAGWRKSSHCTEVGSCAHGIAVRDSRLERSPVLVFGRGSWGRFVSSLRPEPVR